MFQLTNHRNQSPEGVAFWALVFLFVAGMHYMQFHPAGDGLQISFNAFSWIPISIAIGAGLIGIARTATLRTSKLTVQLLVAIAILIVPSFYPDSDSVLDLGRFYTIGAGFLLFVVLQQLQLGERDLTRLFLAVLVAVWIESVFGWMQFLASEPRILFGAFTVGEKAFGVFRQGNVMASFLATGLVLSIYLLARARFNDPEEFLPQIICLLTPLIVVPLLLVLSSRAGWLGALFGGILGLPYLFAQVGRRVTFSWIAMVLLGFFVGLALLEYSDSWFAVVSSIQLDAARAQIYPQVLRMWLENPLLGVGYGNFEASYNVFAASLYAAGITENAGFPNLSHPHNELLYWGAEGGVIALAALLVAAWYVFRSILKAPKGSRLVLVSLFFPIVLHTQTEYPFYHSIVHFIIFVLIIYLVDRLVNEQREIQLKSTLLFGTAGTVIPLATTTFMITTLHAGAVLTRYEQVAGTGVDSLLKIVNPMVWQERIRWELSSSLMYIGLTEGDNRGALAFIDMVKASLEEKPRWRNYQDLIFAYDLIGDTEAGDEAMREAKYRYPKIEFQRQGEGELVILQYDNRARN